MNFDQFESQWLGRRVDYDHVYRYQCVDLILEYIYLCYGINSGVAGNAIDYWVKTGSNGFNDALLSKFTKLATSEAERGDIVVLYGLPGNDAGHIGLATGNINATDVEILEQNGQNGDGDGGNPDTNPNDNVPLNNGNQIRTRWIPRSRVAGLLRPTVAPASPEPAATAPAGDTVILPPNVTSWAVYRRGSALRKGTSDQIGALQPARFGGLDYPIESWVGNYAVNIHTQDFGRVTIWVRDTDARFSDSAAEAPTPLPPPINPNPAPPAGPLIVPSSETYEVIVELDGYQSSNMAVNHINPQVKIPVGTYFVYNKRFEGANVIIGYNITKTPGTPGAWINPADNHEPLPEPPAPEPTPEPPVEVEPPTLPTDEPPAFADSYVAFPAEQVYVAMRDVTVPDLTGERKSATMPKYSVTWISGTFKVDDVEYARPKSAADKGWWYGIELKDPKTGTPNIELEADVFDAKTSLDDRKATKTLHPVDYLLLFVASTHKIYSAFIGFLGKLKLAKKTK